MKEKNCKIGRMFRSGNSSAVYMPKGMATELGWEVGDYLKYEIVDGKLIVTKIEV